MLLVETGESPSPDILLLLHSGISVSGIELWAHKLVEIALSGRADRLEGAT